DKMRNTTGILERKPIRDLRDALAAARGPDGRMLGKRILHVGDGSTAVRTDAREIEKFDWRPLTLSGSILVDTFADWQRAVGSARDSADILFVSNYHNVFRDESRRVLVPPEEVMFWTESHSRIPVVGIGGYFVEDGGMLAIGASGFEQGQTA